MRGFVDHAPAVSVSSADPAVVAELAALLRTGRSVVVCRCAALGTLEFRRPDGTSEQVLLMPLFRGNEQIGLHVACFLRPGRGFSRIDERVGQRIAQLASLVIDHARAVSKTNEASRLKSEFVATMSHELRTPLNVIIGYNEMLLDEAFGEMSSAQRELLLRADRSARSLLALINHTLDLSRLEAGGRQSG